MLTGNLSTRPFYNERLVSLLIAIAAVAGLGMAAFSAGAVYRLSEERSRQKVEQDKVDAEAIRVRAAADSLRQSVDRTNLLMLAAATGEANDLIDQRTFSWTAFFSLVEQTLPLDARLMAVAPRVDRSVFRIVMNVNARRPDDLETFIDALLGTKAFADVLLSELQRNDDGSFTGTIAGSYLAEGAPGLARPAGRGRGWS